MANEPVNPVPPAAITASIGPNTGKPQGHQWDMLANAKTPEDVKKVRDFAVAHGYSPEGQFMQAVADRLAGEG